MNNTILVADDSPTELRLVIDALGKRGYRTVTATDGEEAIEKARQATYADPSHAGARALLDSLTGGKKPALIEDDQTD